MATDEFAGLLSALQEPGSPELKDYEMQYALALEEARRRQRDRSQVPALTQRAKVSDLDRQSPEIRDMLERQYIEGMQPRSDTSQRFPPQPQSYADKLINATKKAYGALPAFSVSTRLSEPLRAPAEAAATLGTGSVALPAGALYGMARAVPEAISTKVFNRPPSPDVNRDVVKDTIEAMTYMPRTEGGQDIIGAAGKLFEESKAPHLWPITPGRPLMTPEAMQVAGARTGMRLGEIKDIPADIRMQQKGLTRLNVMDEPTIGAQLGKGIAATAEAFPQNRQDLGLLLEGQSGAIRPAGTRIVQPQFPPETEPWLYTAAYPEDAAVAKELLRNFATAANTMYTLPRLRIPNTEGQTWANAYIPSRYRTPLLPEPVSLALEQAWLEHWRNYQKSLYPDVAAGNVNDAFKARFNTDQAYHTEQTQQLDAFLQTDKAKEIIGDHYVATPAEYTKRLDAFDNWVENKVVKNYISSKLATPDDPMLKVIAEGKGFTTQLGKPAFPSTRATPTESVQQKRIETGFPAKETPTFLKAEETRAEVDNLNALLTNVRERKAIAQQEGEAIYGLNNHPRHPPFAAASQEEDRLNAKLVRTLTAYDNLMQAVSYENAADDAIRFAYNLPVEEKKSFLRNIAQINRQFFEHTKRAPPTEKLYSYMPNDALKTAIDRAIAEIGTKFLKNEITEKQLQNLDFPKAVASISDALAAKLKLEEEKRKAYRKRLSQQALLDAEKFQPKAEPDGTRVIMIDNQNFTPAEIDRLMSMDTAVLNHCMNNKGSTPREIHAFTGVNDRHYAPYSDPVTGEVEPGAKRQQASYIEGVQNGQQIIASFRDGKTGLPYASIQFRVMQNGLWTLAQLAGPGNQEIVDSTTRARDIASFLNANRHNITTNYDPIDIVKNTNANVTDVLHDESTTQIALALGIPAKEALKYDFYDGEHRFLTKPELREMYAKLQQGTPVATKFSPSLVNPSQQWEYVIDQGMQDVFRRLSQQRMYDAGKDEATTAYSALMHNGYIQVVNDLFAMVPDSHANAINVGLEMLGMELSMLLNTLRYDLNDNIAQVVDTRKAIDAMSSAVADTSKSPIVTFLDNNRQLNGVLVHGTPSFTHALSWFFDNVLNNDDFFNTIDAITLSTFEGLRQAGLTLEGFYPVFDPPNRADAFAEELKNQFYAADNPEYRHRIRLQLEDFVRAHSTNGNIPNLIHSLVAEAADILPMFERATYIYAASELLRYLQENYTHTDLNGKTGYQVSTPTIDRFINNPVYADALHNREAPMPQRFIDARAQQAPAQQAPVQVVDMDIPEEPLVDDQGRLLADFEPEPEVQMPEGPGIVIRGRNEQPNPPLVGPEANAQPPQPQVQPEPVPDAEMNELLGYLEEVIHGRNEQNPPEPIDPNMWRMATYDAGAYDTLAERLTFEEIRDVDLMYDYLIGDLEPEEIANNFPDLFAGEGLVSDDLPKSIQRLLLLLRLQDYLANDADFDATPYIPEIYRQQPPNDIPFAQGGLVERPLTIDDMKYALMMRSA
jgi:hypothetical protein